MVAIIVGDFTVVERRVLIVRQVLVAMLREVFVVDFLGSALGMVLWFTGIARSCAGPGGLSATSTCSRL